MARFVIPRWLDLIHNIGVQLPEDIERRKVARTVVKTNQFYYRLLACKWRYYKNCLNMGSLLIESKIIKYLIDLADFKCKPIFWTHRLNDDDFLNWIKNDSSDKRIDQWIDENTSADDSDNSCDSDCYFDMFK